MKLNFKKLYPIVLMTLIVQTSAQARLCEEIRPCASTLGGGECYGGKAPICVGDPLGVPGLRATIAGSCQAKGKDEMDLVFSVFRCQLGAKLELGNRRWDLVERKRHSNEGVVGVVFMEKNDPSNNALVVKEHPRSPQALLASRFLQESGFHCPNGMLISKTSDEGRNLFQALEKAQTIPNKRQTLPDLAKKPEVPHLLVMDLLNGGTAKDLNAKFSLGDLREIGRMYVYDLFLNNRDRVFLSSGSKNINLGNIMYDLGTKRVAFIDSDVIPLTAKAEDHYHAISFFLKALTKDDGEEFANEIFWALRGKGTRVTQKQLLAIVDGLRAGIAEIKGLDLSRFAVLIATLREEAAIQGVVFDKRTEEDFILLEGFLRGSQEAFSGE
ncbi:MAG: hypothetical protein HYX41_01915 [Bdellovibrio sp.]|nr:hypothetical protein [Bdellovibrio sp.]